MTPWLKRFGLHLAAAVGATGVFVAAAAVGATQTRQQVAVVTPPLATVLRTRTPTAQRQPTVVAATPTTVENPTTEPVPAAESQPTAISASQSSASPVTKPTGARRQPAQPTPVPERTEPTNPPAEPTNVVVPAQGQPAAKPPSPTATARPAPTPTPDKVVPERSLAGTIKQVLADAVDVTGVGGRDWHVVPAPGALIRLNGKAARLDALTPGDSVVILGQAEPATGGRLNFVAHAITAKSK